MYIRRSPAGVMQDACLCASVAVRLAHWLIEVGFFDCRQAVEATGVPDLILR